MSIVLEVQILATKLVIYHNFVILSRLVLQHLMPVLSGLKKVFILAFANKWSTFKLSLLQIVFGFDEVFEFVVVKDLDGRFPILD